MGQLEHILISLRSGIPMKAVDSVEVITDLGLDGDRHAKKGSKRQVLMINMETLEAYGLEPGQVKENLVIRGLDLTNMPRGTHLQVGDVRFELTVECSPCKLLDDIQPGLKEELRGKRGQLFRVIEGGTLSIGDPVQVVETVSS